MNDSQTIASPGMKLMTAWALVGITSWADAAAALAALYSVLLILEWCWKKIGRPFLESQGVIRRKEDK
jgi:hypothetical protein